MTQDHQETEPAWDELSPHIDQALDELPDDLREPLILHFLQDMKQADVANRLEVDQSTVSRRLQSGIEALREKLKKSGIVASASVLGSLLLANSATAAPATLSMQRDWLMGWSGRPLKLLRKRSSAGNTWLNFSKRTSVRVH